MPPILTQVEHIVVVMLENRSFDNMLGWLYAGTAGPAVVLPAGNDPKFDGLAAGMWNTSSATDPDSPAAKVPVAPSVSDPTSPDPDPQETFAHVTSQIFGDQTNPPLGPMTGFVLDYQTRNPPNALQIMEAHSAAQLPVLSSLAKSYAVCDAWFASVPSQTWPNRSFVHAGTSNGHVDNGNPPDPLLWNVQTIFNVLKATGQSWGIYCDSLVAASLTRTMFPKLWDPWLNEHFHGLQAFVDACASNTLPAYSFIEPRFVLNPSDQHPPHDVNAGEALLHEIWTAVSMSPGFDETLLIITYDEHGGCFDHVMPPMGAAAPDPASNPGDANFRFDRFGVRVPTVVVSPYIAAGTVFRSDTAIPYDHTSILATLRDWMSIAPGDMLSSARIAQAPTLSQVLTLPAPRGDRPQIAAPTTAISALSLAEPPNDLQKSLVSGSARRFGQDPAEALARIQTRQHVVDYFKRRPSTINS